MKLNSVKRCNYLIFLGFYILFLEITKRKFVLKRVYFILTFLCLSTLFPTISEAQNLEEEGDLILSGKIIDANTQNGIPFSHIKINDTYWGVISDSLGFFKVLIKPNQRLKVSALGYAEMLVPVTTKVTDGVAFQEIFLEKMSYMLDVVDIYSLGTWNQFKENFIKMDLPEEKNIAANFNYGNLKAIYGTKEVLIPGVASGFGIGIGLNGKSKDQISRERVAHLKSNEYKVTILKNKFNKQLVKDITKEKGSRLEAFMIYVAEKERFTYQTNDIYIQKRIKELYNTFLLEYVDSTYTMEDTIENLRNHLRPYK